MADIADIARYIDTISASLKGPKRRLAGLQPFVTISRQAGAGGHVLAEALLEELGRRGDALGEGWQLFDKEILRLVDEKPALKTAMSTLVNEQFRDQMRDAIFQYVAGTPPQDVSYMKVFEALRVMASGGKAIIIGRGGCCLTRDFPGGVHIRLVAPRPVRLSRLMKGLRLGKAEAEKELKSRDASRAKLIKNYFRKDIDDPLLYDAVFNTDALELPRVARYVMSMIEERAAAARASAAA